MKTALGDARRALARLRRSLEKARRELDALRAALEAATDDGLPDDDYDEATRHVVAVEDWLRSEEARIRAKVLESGGLRPPVA